MARTPRQESRTKIYHVMGRGNNGEKIFQNQKNKIKFLQYMELVMEKISVEIYAYCITDDHVHFLIRAELKDLSKYMHDLTGLYSIYFNGKNDRSGHVFQGRYKSECIEKEVCFWSCLCYIHNHPVRFGIAKEIYGYPYSSAQEYLRKGSNLIHPHARKIIKSRFRTKKEFFDFHKTIDENIFIDISEEQRKQKYIVVKLQLEKFLSNQQVLIGELLLNSRMRREFIETIHKKLNIPYKQIQEFLEIICLEISEIGYERSRRSIEGGK